MGYEFYVQVKDMKSGKREFWFRKDVLIELSFSIPETVEKGKLLRDYLRFIGINTVFEGENILEVQI